MFRIQNIKMLILCLFFVGAVNLIPLGQTQTDYCSQNYTHPCRAYFKNLTLCGAAGKFDVNCPTDAIMVNISETKLLNFVNDKRRIVANDITVAKMNKLHWCKELAEVAQNSVRLCNDTIRFCPLTFHFQHAHIYTREYKSQANETIDTSLMYNWWNDYQEEAEGDLKNFKNIKDAEKFAHFIHDRTTHFGCAIARYTRDVSHHKILLSCVFSHSPNYEQPYEEGPPASKCPENKISKEYTGLCEVPDDILAAVKNVC